MIEYLIGDATKPQEQTTRQFIVQVCNDANMYGAGFSGALECAYPGVEISYRDGIHSLGTNIWHAIDDKLSIISMIAQINPYPRDGSCKLDYEALKTCLYKINDELSKASGDWSIHMPRIGAGLAGGDWNKIEKIIQESLTECAVYVYDLE